jgi:hypothetical protein
MTRRAAKAEIKWADVVHSTIEYTQYNVPLSPLKHHPHSVNNDERDEMSEYTCRHNYKR